MSRTFNTNYWLGDIVFLRVNDDRKPGMVTGVTLRASGGFHYAVTWRGGGETVHYKCELTAEYVPDYAEVQSPSEAAQ